MSHNSTYMRLFLSTAIFVLLTGFSFFTTFSELQKNHSVALVIQTFEKEKAGEIAPYKIRLRVDFIIV